MTWGSGWSTSDIEYAEAIDALMHGQSSLPTSGTYCPASSTYLFMAYPGLMVGPNWSFSQSGDSSGFTNGVGGGIAPPPGGQNAYRQLYMQAALYSAHAGCSAPKRPGPVQRTAGSAVIVAKLSDRRQAIRHIGYPACAALGPARPLPRISPHSSRYSHRTASFMCVRPRRLSPNGTRAR